MGFRLWGRSCKERKQGFQKMLWVLQWTLHRAHGYERLIDALNRFGVDHVFVKPVPFRLRLLPGDFDSPTAVDPDDVPEPTIEALRPVIVMGSYTLAKVAVARGWRPGAFLENTGYDAWGSKWPVLNPGAWTGPLRGARVVSPSFVRPLSDSKSFIGKVYDPVEFQEWQASVIDLGPESYVNGGTPVLVAEPREIYSETRCFVVDGKVVTASLYRVGGQVRYEEVLDGPTLAFARECIQTWVPSRAFVLDIADTPDGFRVVEVNALNAAGFYACDLQKIVGALEDAFPE